VISLTDEQYAIVNHPGDAFILACPGSGKTHAIVARIFRIANTLPLRRGIAVLSFTNTAVDEFMRRCKQSGLVDKFFFPSFIGTFDSFLWHFCFAASGIESFNGRPTVVDSWDTLGIEVRLSGNRAFKGGGVSLDLFDAQTNQIDTGKVGHRGLRTHIEQNLTAYVQEAARRRQNLLRNGYVSAADIRIHVLKKLLSPEYANALGKALAARFQEVIVDEAQDCNPLDCQIIKWLQDQGISVIIVADPDQAIYGFRHGNPSDLLKLFEEHPSSGRLSLTGNFRSTPVICAAAATLRNRVEPDEALGETRILDEPVHVLAYKSARVPASIGKYFLELLSLAKIPPDKGIVLAHARRKSLAACGFKYENQVGNSKVAIIAQAVGMFWSPRASTRTRESALQLAEKSLLDVMGMIQNGDTSSRAAKREGIDPRWLRRSALQLISRLPRSCEDTNERRSEWVEALRSEIRRLGIIYHSGTSEKRFFQDRRDAEWNQLLDSQEVTRISCGTIHEAKGKQYEAVCVVLPPDSGDFRRTEELITHWEGRTEDESKRVVYVGITRARKLVAIAIPELFRNRIETILNAGDVNYRVHTI